MNIDTLSIARDLKAAEVPTEQAEAIAAAIGRSVTEGSATKDDLTLVRADVGAVKLELKTDISAVKLELKGDIAALKLELKGDIESLRTEIEKSRNQVITWVIGAQVALGGIIIAVLKF